MNFNKSNKLLKKIKNYRVINNENYNHIKDLAKWLFIELKRQEFNEIIDKKGCKNVRTGKKDTTCQ